MRRFEREFRNRTPRRPIRRSRLNESYQPLYENRQTMNDFKGLQNVLGMFSETGIEEHLYYIEGLIDGRDLKRMGFNEIRVDSRRLNMTLNDFAQKVSNGMFGLFEYYYPGNAIIIYAPNLDTSIFDFVVTSIRNAQLSRRYNQDVIQGIQETMKRIWIDFYDTNSNM